MTTDHEGAAPIRTPDQRLRVFVSSTLAELAPERAAVARAISALRLTPVMFELGARPHPPRELYRAYLAQSDVFVGLYWQRYGWIGPGMDISGLEDELRLSDGMPRLLYLKSPAPEQEPRLAAMIADLQSEGADSYRSFRSTRELGRLVRDDLALLLSERFATPVPSAAPAAAPAATEIRPPRRSLPTPSTSLLGREDDIAELSSLLESPDVRLVTLTGPGGIGKTRLAIAVGAALDGAGRRTEFVPLASITDPALVLPRVAAAVGAPIEGTRSALDTLIEHFAQTPTLLVLDNLEQVTGAATELDQLLAACPDVTILATSRTVLRLRAEREYPVEALMVPAFAERPPLEELAALPAVRLFVDRARAVRHDFTLDDTNAAAVMEICRRLDGLPLAIELAAARTRVLAPVALLARLEHVLDSLGTGPVDLPERQRTLRATVEWSFGLLDDMERELVEALSVFADGWTIDAATRVVARTEDETLDLLDALAGHSLVSVVADDAWTALPHARDGAGARRRAARRRRRRCRRRPATRRVLRRAGDGRQLAGGTTGRVGRSTGRRGGEPASRDPLVLRPRHHAAPPHVSRALAVLADARPDDRGSGVDRRAATAGRLVGRARPGRGAVHVGGDGGRGRRRRQRPRRDRRHRAVRRTGRRSAPAERAAAGRRLDAADP